MFRALKVCFFQLYYRDIIMNSHEFDGKLIEFDDDGDRISAKFRIINVMEDELATVGEYVVVKFFRILNFELKFATSLNRL